MTNKSSTTLFLMAALLNVTSLHAQSSIESSVNILERYVEDYALDPNAVHISFGIEVDQQRWHVVSERQTDDSFEVHLADGFPDTPLFYYTMSRDVLDLIDQGKMSALTAMGAATSAQKTPLDVGFTQGYERPADYDAVFRTLSFHFWTRGLPEIVPLGATHAKAVHGAPAVVMYYDRDFRSAVYHIPPKLGQDMAPTLVVPFPRLLVVLEGEMTGMVSDDAFSIPKGHMLFIPPNAPAQVWNDQDAPLQFMFLMFGDGA